MESNIKGLVAAGHEMASELKAECGAVDMRSVAKLISDLATQLEVQLVRANALAAENARLKSAHPQPFGPEMMKALDAYEKYQDEVPETGMLNAFFILRDSIRVDTPATDAFLAEVCGIADDYRRCAARWSSHCDYGLVRVRERRTGNHVWCISGVNDRWQWYTLAGRNQPY